VSRMEKNLYVYMFVLYVPVLVLITLKSLPVSWENGDPLKRGPLGSPFSQEYDLGPRFPRNMGTRHFPVNIGTGVSMLPGKWGNRRLYTC